MSNSDSAHPNADVRMRGFAQRSTVEEAWEWVDSTIPKFAELQVEEVSLLKAAGRVLARDIKSSVNVPAFPRAMMDGFALRADDTQGSTSYNSLPLRILGASLPGNPFAGVVQSGGAVRIMTGAPLPEGADAVLPIENAQIAGDLVLIMGNVPPGKHVGQIGEDVRSGEVVLQVGQVLRPQDIGMLSALGFSSACVVRQPRVRIFITGNELLPMGTSPSGYRITDSNGPMLTALVTRDGGNSSGPIMIPDDRDPILAALRDEADVLLVSGGSSVGEEDHVPTLLAEHGELAVHGIAIRPSSPTGMGSLEERLVFLLPGNPVSCLCAYDFFAGRAIRALGGRSRGWPYPSIRLKLARKIVSVVGRVDYARVSIRENEAVPLAIGGASVLSSVTRADGFVVVPSDSEGYPEGAEVTVYRYI